MDELIYLVAFSLLLLAGVFAGLLCYLFDGPLETIKRSSSLGLLLQLFFSIMVGENMRIEFWPITIVLGALAISSVLLAGFCLPMMPEIFSRQRKT
jgi:hypothetical protein